MSRRATQGGERAAGGAPAGQIPALGGRAQERAAERTGSGAWRAAARGRERAGGDVEGELGGGACGAVRG